MEVADVAEVVGVLGVARHSAAIVPVAREDLPAAHHRCPVPRFPPPLVQTPAFSQVHRAQ